MSAAAPPKLVVEDVTLRYRTAERVVTATSRVNFAVYPAERFVLLGPSGCGKSTLLKAIGGFIRPAAGAIRLNGRPIERPNVDRMMVFQEFDQLLPWKTVEQNVMFPMLASGKWRADDVRARTSAAIEMVGLAQFRGAHPHTLSGGMKQRVAIARAMAMEPEVLLMDEPFAALDALTRQLMQKELLRLWENTRFTMVFVTHSIEEAIVLGSRILILSPHPGRVRAELNAQIDQGREESGAFKALYDRIQSLLFETGGADEGRPNV
ncbi:MAG TPA: ABC transporter ATP-binding protein [Stellaceae bacterium]|nr:ABC transporter ATP-binding protein [Stellaceae bacterium]